MIRDMGGRCVRSATIGIRLRLALLGVVSERRRETGRGIKKNFGRFFGK